MSDISLIVEPPVARVRLNRTPEWPPAPRPPAVNRCFSPPPSPFPTLITFARSVRRAIIADLGGFANKIPVSGSFWRSKTNFRRAGHGSAVAKAGSAPAALLAKCEGCHIRLPGSALSMLPSGHSSIEDGTDERATNRISVVEIRPVGTISREVPELAIQRLCREYAGGGSAGFNRRKRVGLISRRASRSPRSVSCNRRRRR